MSRRTSIYLTDDLDKQLQASGLTLLQVVRRGLAAGDPEPCEATLRRVMPELLAGIAVPSEVPASRCPDCGTGLACPRCNGGDPYA